MGLERLACIVQDVDSMFDVDTIKELREHVSRLADAEYGKEYEMCIRDSVKPNAGLTKQKDGAVYYDVDPAEFASVMEKIVEGGAAVAGGCCGTTPAPVSYTHLGVCKRQGGTCCDPVCGRRGSERI